MGDGAYVYAYTDDDGPSLQEGLLLTIAGDLATFGYLDEAGAQASASVGLVRRPAEEWQVYTPPKNIDSYRCEHASLDVPTLDLPGVLDGPGNEPASVLAVAPEREASPELFAECTQE